MLFATIYTLSYNGPDHRALGARDNHDPSDGRSETLEKEGVRFGFKGLPLCRSAASPYPPGGQNNSSTERFGSDILIERKDQRVCRDGKSDRYEEVNS